ncbi:terpene synthase family protein [Streptomyces sp. NPDC049555]|uniref:terpene synthase family protein n=1 Tax=unclassified Streptomyces TaxID=2593676 RepID=UPI00342D51C8
MHPRVRELDHLSVEWMLQKQLDTSRQQRKRLSQCDFGGLTAKTMPYGQMGPLSVVAKMHSVLFSLDDALCDESRATAHDLAHATSRIMRVLEAPSPAWPDDSPHAAALRAIRTELADYASPRQLRRWTEGMRIYLSGLVWEAACRRDRVLPTLNDYAAMWMRAIGMAPSTALMDIAGGYDLPDQELDRPEVRALTEMTWTLVAWDNDFYSRNKEIHRAGDHLNLIDVLAHERGTSPARVQAEAMAMRDRVMTCFLRLREQVWRRAGVELRCYLVALGQFVRGHLDWAASCSRYADPRTVDLSAWWATRPSDDSTAPLPVPSIAWWWDLLEQDDYDDYDRRSQFVSDLHQEDRPADGAGARDGAGMTTDCAGLPV